MATTVQRSIAAVPEPAVAPMILVPDSCRRELCREADSTGFPSLVMMFGAAHRDQPEGWTVQARTSHRPGSSESDLEGSAAAGATS